MIKKIGLLKQLAKKIGKARTLELLSIIESEEQFSVEVTVKKQGLEPQTNIIKLNDNQEVILKYIG